MLDNLLLKTKCGLLIDFNFILLYFLYLDHNKITYALRCLLSGQVDSQVGIFNLTPNSFLLLVCQIWLILATSAKREQHWAKFKMSFVGKLVEILIKSSVGKHVKLAFWILHNFFEGGDCSIGFIQRQFLAKCDSFLNRTLSLPNHD